MSDKVPDWVQTLTHEINLVLPYPIVQERIAAALLSAYRRGVEERDAEAKRREQELNLELGGVRRSWRDEQTKSKSEYRRGVEDSAKALETAENALWEKAEVRLSTERDDAFAAFVVGNCISAIRRLGEAE